MARLISVVLPVYNEAGSLRQLHKELRAMATKAGKNYSFEFIFVNDGSADKSPAILRAIARSDARITIINLSRNFGHQLAITAGLDHAKGQAVITMDSDLQDPPDLSIKLIQQWRRGYQIVYAKRRSRRGESLFKKITAKLFYGFINKLSETPIPANVGDFRLMDRQVVDELNKFREHHRFLRGLVGYLGFKSTTVEFDRLARRSGSTAYPVQKMIRLALDGITSFSTAPIKLISRLGYFVSVLSLIGIIYTLIIRLFEPSRAVPGWAFVTVAMFFIGGVQLVMLGILGSYIGRLYGEAQRRPLYIIASVYHRPKRAAAKS